MLLANCGNNGFLFWFSWSSPCSLWIASPNIHNGLFCEQGRTVPFSKTTPPTLNHVRYIFSLRSCAQMVWIYTWRIVTTVKKEFIFRDFLPCKYPGNAVGAEPSIMSSVPDKSVMMFRFLVGNSGTSPHPTVTQRWLSRVWRSIFVNFLPKSIFHWDSYKATFGVDFHTPNVTSVVPNMQEVRA